MIAEKATEAVVTGSKPFITINGRRIGEGYSTYMIAEMSANHNHDFDEAVRLVHAAKEAGADAIKLQTYTPDTMTIDSRKEPFIVGKGTIWEGRNLYELYQDAYTPWEWQPKLKEIAEDLGLDCFSTPFDSTSVDFLEEMDVDAYKIASFELIDLPLIERVAQQSKPTIISTGMSTLTEIDEAVRTFKKAGGTQLALLKCNSGYPAPPEEMNLRTIPNMADTFGVPVGLSDHTLTMAASVAAVALGACIIEKHFTIDRSVPGPDAAFSLMPHEFRAMVDTVRETEKALGKVNYQPSPKEMASQIFRRSVFVTADIKSGEALTEANTRVIRPSNGLHPRYFREVLGRRASRDIEAGTPLSWDLVG